MNAIRAKIIGSWLLFLTCAGMIYFHHLFTAWCVYGLVLFIRNTKPKTPQFPQRVGYVLGFGFIAFLVLCLIDAYYPFPHRIQVAGETLAVIILWPVPFYAVYLDYKAFKTTHDPIA